MYPRVSRSYLDLVRLSLSIDYKYVFYNYEVLDIICGDGNLEIIDGKTLHVRFKEFVVICTVSDGCIFEFPISSWTHMCQDWLQLLYGSAVKL